MNFYNMSIAQALDNAGVRADTGLSAAVAEKHRQRYGRNILKQKKQKSIFIRFLSQFSDFMVVILLIAAAVSFVISIMQGETDITDPIVILLIVIINAVVGVIQESRAEHAIKELNGLNTQKACVLRGSKRVMVASDEVTIGDILILEAGYIIAADARIIEAVNLKTEESSLTGESEPVEKNTLAIKQKDILASQMKNTVFSGTAVVSGRGKAVVIAIGMDTQIGKIAGLINEHTDEPTPLQKRLTQTGRILGIGALVICAVIFIIGILQGNSPADTFMIAVSLSVAAIPEGLLAIVTIVLALGVVTMAKNNAVIRRLEAVETLGRATVICADKTGTLTKNIMTVCEVSGAHGKVPLKCEEARRVLSLATLCNNSVAGRVNGKYTVTGDSTETAIVVACSACGITKSSLQEQFPRVKEIPFNSTRKMMTTIHRSNGGYRVITKGAPEVLLERCNVDYAQKQEILRQNTEMGNRALRVLAVAYKDIDEMNGELEGGLTFTGLIGMMDPPRENVRTAVSICRRAGIKPVMITGDHAVTARAIAKQTGIFTSSSVVIEGAKLDKMSDEELRSCIKDCSVFARVSPEHKMRIIKAYRCTGEIVAMTGDGVNDAPALKAADIGCAMGKNGTQVAKSAADMVLTDDNFATIVEAVRHGRGIYENIRKAVHFLLSCNIGEIMTIFTATLLGFETPLLAIQLLFVNLVTDSLPAISLGLEKTDANVMNRRPVNPKKSLFSDGLTKDIVCEGLMIGAITLLGFTAGKLLFSSVEVGRTIAFCVLSLSQLVHAFNIRSKKSLFEIGVFSNKSMCRSFVICALMQVSVVAFPPFAAVFKTVPLDLAGWAVVAVLSAIPLLAVEAGKSIF